MIKLTEKDLINIHDLAIRACVSLSHRSKFHKDNSKLQSYTYAEAIISLLNSKNVLSSEVKVEKGYVEDE